MEPSSTPQAAFLVEDSALIRGNLILAMAEVAGTRVIACAESEAEAADWLRQDPHAWNRAVIDMFLREGTGLGVLKSWHARARGQRAAVQCMALGADAVFDKSTEIDAFLDFCGASP